MKNESTPPDHEKEPEGKTFSGSKALVTWCLLIGVMTLVIAPVATIKMAEWKWRQESVHKAETAETSPPTQENHDQASAKPNFGGPFTLTDQNGNTVTDASFRGKNLLVYFGYTYCPDLCPTALQNITETLDELGPAADNVRVLFITVDPARDTPAKLKDYVESFHPNIVGLTGSPEQIAAVAKAYGATYAKAETVDDGNYMMDASTFMYVEDAQGKPLASMDMEQVDPSTIADTLRDLWGLPKPANKSSANTEQQPATDGDADQEP